MFTLEIEGRAIVVADALRVEAAEVFESETFKEDLRTLTSNGSALWDGKARLIVRPASDDEIESFDEAMSDEDYLEDEDDAATADEEEEDDPIDLVFLVEIDSLDDGAANGDLAS